MSHVRVGTEEILADGASRVVESAGNEGVLTALFRGHQLPLVRMALVIVGDQASAEDVVQDVFIALQGRVERLHEIDDLVPYARTAVVNRCRTVLRRRKLARLAQVDHQPPAWSAESVVMLGEEHREVLNALRDLPRRQREAVALRYYLNLDEAAIAETMGVSRGTVKSTLSRALAALARKLEMNS